MIYFKQKGGIVDTLRKRKIDKIIGLKAVVFDTIRRLEMLQNAAKQVVEAKDKALKELVDLEGKILNRYTRAKKLVNK